MKWQNLLSLFIISISPYIISCGGTSETGNARIASLSGSILINDCDTAKVWVHLVNENYIPGTDTPEMVYKVAVDLDGGYHFKSVLCNNYYLYIKGSDRNLLRGPFPVSIPEIELGKDTLHYTSKVTVNIPDSADLDFVFIRGVPELYSVISGKAVLPSAPEGTLEIIARSTQNSSKPLDTIDLKRTIILDVTQGDTVSVGLHATAPVFEKTSTTMSRTVSLDCTRRYQDVLLVGNTTTDSITFRILQAPSDLRLNSSSGVISWTVPDTLINRSVNIGAIAENINGSSRSIWWAVTFQSTCSLTISKPNPPSGPDSSVINKNCYFYTDSTDQNAKLMYRFHWGDSVISEWSTLQVATHIWTEPGTYYVSVQSATIDTSVISQISDPHPISIGIYIETKPTPRPRIILSTDTIPVEQKLCLAIIDDSCTTVDIRVRWNDTNTTNWSTTNPFFHSWDKPGVYAANVTVIYEQMSYNDTITNTCIINVVPRDMSDTIPPVVTLFGESEVQIAVLTPYQDSGAAAIDDRDGDISFSIKTITNINVSKAGSYFYLYTAKDSVGNVTTAVRNVIVK